MEDEKIEIAPEEVISWIEKVGKTRLSLLKKKNQDYAKDKEFFSNFRVISSSLSALVGKDVTPADVALVFLLTKLSRQRNLAGKAAEPNYESMEDTCIDAHNYLDIWFLLSIYEGKKAAE